MINKKKLISSVGIGMCIANSMVMFITFLFAFFNGGFFAIQINLYNEALPELIIIPISIILSIYGLIQYIKN